MISGSPGKNTNLGWYHATSRIGHSSTSGPPHLTYYLLRNKNRAATKFFVSVGAIVHFDDLQTDLKNIVILDPQVLMPRASLANVLIISHL